ncbi:MAG: hypothetical protein KH009_02745 [Clostridiales bacterium]|nr:hypothetical protein [Clostridiales bacterium]
MTSSQLKWIAILAMTADHVGAVLLPGLVPLRIFGRLTMPIMCFLLTEGYRHTRSLRRYAGRLALFALISEFPFDLAFYGGIFWGAQNVFFTLLFGLLALSAWESRRSTAPAEVLFWAVTASLLGADYGIYGVALILLFHLTRERPRMTAAGMAVLTLLAFGPSLQLYSLLALPLLARYNGERGGGQQLFYLYYPLHLLVLGAVRLL